MQIEHIQRNGRSGVVIFHWGQDRPAFDFSHPPYFYSPGHLQTPEGTPLGGAIVGGRYVGIDDRPLRKITCKSADNVSKLRGTDHYDANIPYVQRYWIDKVAEVPVENPVVCYIDIEVASDGKPINNAYIKKAPDPIIIFGLWDNVRKKLFQFCWRKDFIPRIIDTVKRSIQLFNTEKTMARAVVDYLAKLRPDILTGYNIDNYDAIYTITRFTKLQVGIQRLSKLKVVKINSHNEAIIKGMAIFDLYKGYIHLQHRRFDDNSLNAVLKRELKVSKFEGVNGAYMAKEWEEEWTKVIEYNYWDVQYMVDLDHHLDILNTHIEFHSVFGSNLYETYYASRTLEPYMMKRLEGCIFPSTKNIKKQLIGAAPKPPVKGLHDWIVFIDFTSAYPTAMMAGNMSFDTKLLEPVDGCINVDGTCFTQHDQKKGKYVEIIEELMERKKYWGDVASQYEYKSPEWKKAFNIRYAYKAGGLNAIYGLVGDSNSRFYDVDIANAVTFMIRGAADYTIHEVKREFGYKYIFGHTDSMGFQPGSRNLDELIDIGYEVINHMNGKYPLFMEQFGIKKEYAKLFVDFEKIARRGIFSGKTRYAIKLGWADGKKIKSVTDGSDIEIKGFDTIRSDASRLSRKLQKQLIIDILNKKPRKEIEPILMKELNKISNGEYHPLEIGVPSGMSKQLKDYQPGYPARVASEWSNNVLGTNFGKDTKPFRINIKVPPGLLNTKAPNGGTIYDSKYMGIDAVTEIPDWVRIQWKEHMEQTKRKLSFVYECLAWDVNSLTGQKKLGDF